MSRRRRALLGPAIAAVAAAVGAACGLALPPVSMAAAPYDHVVTAARIASNGIAAPVEGQSAVSATPPAATSSHPSVLFSRELLEPTWLPSARSSTSSVALEQQVPSGNHLGAAEQLRGRSMWVWTQPPVAPLTSFAHAHAVNALYVNVHPSPSAAEVAWLRSLKAAAAPLGIRLWALGGDPTWPTRQADALAWQRSALAVGVFSGTHVDIEPYSLPAWSQPAGRANLASADLDLLARLRAASPLPLGVDAPFWAGQVRTRTGASWADGILRRASVVTVMSYRDNAKCILEVGEDLLERGDRAGTPVQLAAETDPLADCPRCTFAQRTANSLMTAVIQVEAEAARHRSFAGVSVHRYLAWRALP